MKRAPVRQALIVAACFLLSALMITIPGPSTHAAGITAIIHVLGDYPTIQAAHDAASPGDTIVVAAGLYDEQVKITKSLTIKGAGWLSTVIRPSTAVVNSSSLTPAPTWRESLSWTGRRT